MTVGGVRGYTLAEALVALLLMAVLTQAAWSVAAVHGSAAFGLVSRAEMLDAARVSTWVLREELRQGEAGRDWLVGDDSISLRAFRATGVTCPSSGEPGAIIVASSGIRQADPAKDSVLVLWPDGQWRAHRLDGVASADACASNLGRSRTWRLDPPEAGGYVLRVFERGSYHVSDRAFRYRRGRGGRQPLTPRALGPGSGLGAGPGSTALLRLEPQPGRGGEAWVTEWILWPRPDS